MEDKKENKIEDYDRFLVDQIIKEHQDEDTQKNVSALNKKREREEKKVGKGGFLYNPDEDSSSSDSENYENAQAIIFDNMYNNNNSIPFSDETFEEFNEFCANKTNSY